MTFMRCGLIVVVTLIGATASCSYSQPKPAEGGESTEVTPPPKEAGEASPSASESAPAADAPPAAPTGACDDRACTVDQDCCEGYGCALDPERSRVQRFCLAR
jgi:hypothetical protein